MPEIFQIDLKNALEVDPDQFQKMMDEIHTQNLKAIELLAEELNISEKSASDIIYLRSRSRWTQELEDRYIQEIKEGAIINIMEWPPR